jgi:hypothetical protein
VARPRIRSKDKKTLFARAGNRCSFPGCSATLLTEDGVLIGHICHIAAFFEGGPRYDSTKSFDELDSLDNLIALCPTHHAIVDSRPSVYTTEWLKAAKVAHEKRAQRVSADFALEKVKLDKISAVSFSEALNIWRENEENADEEFWQKFFERNPRLIAQAVPNHILKLGQKCYVGGKSIENQGGNLIDFLYFTYSSKNVVLVEIKTPATKLIGQRYRRNAYSITEELSGAIVQVLNYRDELLKNYYSLCGQDSIPQFSTFNPQCLIVAGNLGIENPNAVQRKSFDLFRSILSPVSIVTFDDLFGKVNDLLDIIG